MSQYVNKFIITTATIGVMVAGISVPATAADVPTYDPQATFVVDCIQVVTPKGVTENETRLSVKFSNKGSSTFGAEAEVVNSLYGDDMAISGAYTEEPITVKPGKSTGLIPLASFLNGTMQVGYDVAETFVTLKAADTEFADLGPIDPAVLCDNIAEGQAAKGQKFVIRHSSTCTVGFPVHATETCLKRTESVRVTNKSNIKKAAKVRVVGEAANEWSAFPTTLPVKTVKIGRNQSATVAFMSHQAGGSFFYRGENFGSLNDSTYHVVSKGWVLSTKMGLGLEVPWWELAKARSGE